MLYKRFILKKYCFPVDGYRYYVEEWRSADQVNYGFYGHMCQFKTKKEAENFIRDKKV